jgi:peptidoglycan/LPS O-acetylase OafA/YrhL
MLVITTTPGTAAIDMSGTALEPPQSVGPPKLRLAHLDGIRAVAACYVVLHHIWTTVWPGYPNQTAPWWTDWLKHGHFAVAIFIVVSGFSLALQPSRTEWQMDGGPGRFFSRRGWRIVPPYWAALALSCAVIALTSGVVHFVDGTINHRDLTVKSVVVHALLLQDVIGSPTPNGAFWSIAIEWQIYFLFPLVLIVRRLAGPIATPIAALGVTVAAYLLATNVSGLERIANLLPQFFALFVFGMLAVEAVRHREKVPRWLMPVSLIAFAGVLAIGEIVGDRATVRQFFWFDLGIGACTAALLAGLCGPGDSVVRNALATGPARALGRFSYSIYLVHLPILTLVWIYIVIPLRPSPIAAFAMLTGLGAACVILGAWLFSLVFEEPFIRHRSWGEFRAAGRAVKVPSVLRVVE